MASHTQIVGPTRPALPSLLCPERYAEPRHGLREQRLCFPFIWMRKLRHKVVETFTRPHS